MYNVQCIPIVAHFANILSQNELTSGYTRSKFICKWCTIKKEKIVNSEKGVSLIESLLVVVVVASIVFLISSLPNALTLVSKSRHLSLAREIAAKQIEDKRMISYDNLVSDESPISDSRLNLLPQGSGVVIVEDCNLSICELGEAVKQVTAEVIWQDNNKPQSVILKTMISEGGLNQ